MYELWGWALLLFWSVFHFYVFLFILLFHILVGGMGKWVQVDSFLPKSLVNCYMNAPLKGMCMLRHIHKNTHSHKKQWPVFGPVLAVLFSVVQGQPLPLDHVKAGNEIHYGNSTG